MSHPFTRRGALTALAGLAALAARPVFARPFDEVNADGTLGARELKAAGGVVLAECVPEDLAKDEKSDILKMLKDAEEKERKDEEEGLRLEREKATQGHQCRSTTRGSGTGD